MACLITHVQENAESLLLANPFFTDWEIPVIVFDKGDILNIIDRAVATLGIYVLISTPEKRKSEIEAPGPYSEIDLEVEVFENVILNRQGVEGTDYVTAPQVVEQVENTLHQNPDADNNVFVWTGSTLSGAGRTKERDQTFLIWVSGFKTKGGVTQTTVRATTPVIVDGGAGVITITTNSFPVYYTTNGKTPNPRSGTLYTVGFSILSGVTVKARAWTWGYTVSEPASYTRA